MGSGPGRTRELLNGRQARGKQGKIPSALTKHMGQASDQKRLSPHDVNAAFKDMSF